MKTLFKLAASAFVVFAAASACQKPEGGPDTPGGSQNPLENAIEFAGKETKSRLFSSLLTSIPITSPPRPASRALENSREPIMSH